MHEIADSLQLAFDRIEDFREIQDSASEGVRLEAVLCLQEAVGIAGPSRELLRERIIEAADAPSEPGQLIFGVIVGLLAAQFESERVGAQPIG